MRGGSLAAPSYLIFVKKLAASREGRSWTPTLRSAGCCPDIPSARTSGNWGLAGFGICAPGARSNRPPPPSAPQRDASHPLPVGPNSTSNVRKSDVHSTDAIRTRSSISPGCSCVLSTKSASCSTSVSALSPVSGCPSRGKGLRFACQCSLPRRLRL